VLRKGAYWVGLAGVFLLSAEVAARVDDWLHLGVPFWASPDYERDLLVQDQGGKHGKPHGRFKKWQLNAFGFRGPEMALQPTPGRRRVMVLGASEMFGLCESSGKELSAQLAGLLGDKGHDEVVNAAIAGMTVRGMIPYWQKWAAQFRPDVVVIYPSPLFYLYDYPPGAARADSAAAAPVPEPGIHSRLVLRVKDVFHVPDFIQKWRDERAIAARTAGKGPEWFFDSVPQDRLDLFAADLAELIRLVRRDGATPVLLTHATRAASPPRTEDLADLHVMRIHLPRATEEVMAEFERAAGQREVALGADLGVAVVDVAGVMNGHREWFADLVHFNDEGAAVIASLVAQRLQALPDPAVARRRTEPAASPAAH
jgi:lysophospholipase L1-like esterase